jgi:hypothetical protein
MLQKKLKTKKKNFCLFYRDGSVLKIGEAQMKKALQYSPTPG